MFLKCTDFSIHIAFISAFAFVFNDTTINSRDQFVSHHNSRYEKMYLNAVIHIK